MICGGCCHCLLVRGALCVFDALVGATADRRPRGLRPYGHDLSVRSLVSSTVGAPGAAAFPQTSATFGHSPRLLRSNGEDES